MKTQREIIREHREQLDKKWEEKYPEGRFTILEVRRKGNPPEHKYYLEKELKRPTSGHRRYIQYNIKGEKTRNWFISTSRIKLHKEFFSSFKEFSKKAKEIGFKEEVIEKLK